MACVPGGHVKRRERIRYDVRGGRKVLAAGRREIQNPLNTIHHVAGFPTGHCHIVERLSSFLRREFCGRAHLFGLFGQFLQLRRRGPGDGPHLRHCRLKTFVCVYGVLQSDTDSEYGPGLKDRIFQDVQDSAYRRGHEVKRFQRNIPRPARKTGQNAFDGREDGRNFVFGLKRNLPFLPRPALQIFLGLVGLSVKLADLLRGFAKRALCAARRIGEVLQVFDNSL